MLIRKLIPLSSKRCQTMIKYGSYLHKSRVTVFRFLTAILYKSVLLQRTVSVVSFRPKFAILRSVARDKNNTLNTIS